MAVFDPVQYEALENRIKQPAMAGEAEALEDLESLKNCVRAFFRYVDRVTEQQLESRMAAGILKGEALREHTLHFDGARRAAHEPAIVSARLLNRLAAAYGAGPVFLGDGTDRFQVGDFCGEISAWFFTNRGR